MQFRILGLGEMVEREDYDQVLYIITGLQVF